MKKFIINVLAVISVLSYVAFINQANAMEVSVSGAQYVQTNEAQSTDTGDSVHFSFDF